MSERNDRLEEALALRDLAVDSAPFAIVADEVVRLRASEAAAVKRAEDAEGELKSLRWVVKETPSMQALATLRSQLAQAREALELAAPHHQGGHSKVGAAIRAALSPPSPGAETRWQEQHDPADAPREAAPSGSGVEREEER